MKGVKKRDVRKQLSLSPDHIWAISRCRRGLLCNCLCLCLSHPSSFSSFPSTSMSFSSSSSSSVFESVSRVNNSLSPFWTALAVCRNVWKGCECDWIDGIEILYCPPDEERYWPRHCHLPLWSDSRSKWRSGPESVSGRDWLCKRTVQSQRVSFERKSVNQLKNEHDNALS